MRNFSIERGERPRAQKVVIYGPEGVGKTTLAARFPFPLFIDTEGGSGHIDVARLPQPRDWQELLDEVEWVRFHPRECSTLVVDTADWAQTLAQRAVCDEKNLKSIEDIGYGKGYTYVCERFAALLKSLDGCIDLGINVVVTAHAVVTKFEQPDEMGAYDRWSLKLQDGKKASVCAALKEWADAVLFANYKTEVVSVQGGKVKAQGGKRRMLWCSHTATVDAKNRWGLADTVPMEWEQIAPHIPSKRDEPARAEQPADDIDVPFDTRPDHVINLERRMREGGITDEQMRRAVSALSGGKVPETTPVSDYPQGFIESILSDGYWPRLIAYIND
jgi:hypothetical protein